jgi:hypothetical protein
MDMGTGPPTGILINRVGGSRSGSSLSLTARRGGGGGWTGRALVVPPDMVDRA